MENIVELESNDIVKDNIEKLKEIFPDIVKDGKIDFDTLKLVLGEEIETDKENYKFEWVGKRDCYKTIQTPSNGTLKYIEKDSLNPNIGENIIIEGDNLEVLKLLQSSYGKDGGQIKMIYIDPPYNTGNDFVYPDNYETPLDNYLELTGQKVNGETTQSKKSKDGRKHTQWLNMIFPRLHLCRILLKNDGVIFISIDDNEVNNLRIICEEVFGEENFVGEFPRITKKSGKSSDDISKNHDTVLCFRKTSLFKLNEFEHTDRGFKHTDEFVEERGKYKLNQTLDYDSIQYSSSLDYEITLKDKVLRPGNVSYEDMLERQKRNPKNDFCWRWSKDLFEFGLNNGFVVLKEYKTYSRIYTKTYENCTISKNENGYFIEYEQRSKSVSTLDFIDNKYSNDNSKKDIVKVFGKSIFDYSKPVELLKTLIYLGTDKSDIVLDFFGGSGTTGQSVLELNQEDGGNRKFILVQLPEPTSNPDYPTISEITKDRIRRVINGYGDNPQPINDGFKVFKLDKSNYKVNEKINVNKDSDKEDIIQKLRLQFRSSIVHDQSLVEGYNETDIIYENIIKEGYNLNSKIELVENIKEYKVYKITDIKNKKFYITFDKLNTDITQNKEFMGISNDTLFICFDHNLSDSDKSNLSKTFLLKTI